MQAASMTLLMHGACQAVPSNLSVLPFLLPVHGLVCLAQVVMRQAAVLIVWSACPSHLAQTCDDDHVQHSLTVTDPTAAQVAELAEVALFERLL